MPSSQKQPSSASLSIQQAKLLYQQSWLSLSGMYACCLLFATIFWDISDKTTLQTWVALITVFVIFRYILTSYYLQKENPTDEQARRWMVIFCFMTAITGCLWGAGAILFYPASEPAFYTFLLLVLGGLTVASMATYAIYLPASYSFIIPTLTLAITGGFLHSDQLPLSITLMVGVFFLVLLHTARVVNRLTLHSITLNQENINLISVLHNAKEQAEHANETKSRFLTNISHEVRTPLNAIINLTRDSLEDAPPPKMKEKLSLVENSAYSLLALLNELLDIARIEEGKLDVSYAPFSLRELLDDVIQLVAPEAARKKLQLKLETDENIPQMLLGSSNRLRQVLLNLLFNAVKFTNKGSVSLCTSILKSNDQELSIVFAVQDSGIGIPEEKLSDIFENFEQVNGTILNYTSQGVGLGLSIAREFVRLMGGELSVASTVGVGSTFRFILRFERIAEKKPALTHKKHSEPELLNLQWLNLSVLVAEDNEVNQLIIKTLLEKKFKELDLAKDGAEAVQMARKKEYQLVLMDVQMPVMDGMKATSELRQEGVESATKPDVPIIALTACSMKGDKEKFIEAGMNRYCVKPVHREELYKEIERLIPHHTQADKNNKTIKEGAEKEENLQTVNETAALDYVGGDMPLLQEMTKIFLKSFPQRFDELSEALKAKDRNNINRAAHYLKGGSSGVGAERFSNLMQKIEESSKKSSFQKLEELFNDATKEYQKLTELFQKKYSFEKTEE